MMRRVRTAWVTGSLALAGAGVAGMAVIASAQPAPQDDLAVVKRAVAQNRAPEAAPQAPRAATERPVRPAGKEPTWLKVRVTEKTSGRKKVTVNLPLALVRAVGDGWPRIDFNCGDDRRARCGIKVSEVLAALEAGQDLVEIDDEHETVKVWVE